MGTIWVKEFVGGLDGRRLPETTKGGALIKLTDGHINRGGEIEQRPRLVKTHDLPPNATKGLAATSTGLYVFGHTAEPAGIPAGITYQRIRLANAGDALTAVLSTDLYDDRLYVAARYESGDRGQFYDGDRVPDENWPADRPLPNYVETIKRAMYAISGSYLFRSGITPITPDADDFNFVFDETDNPSAFVINMSSETGGAVKLKAVVRYGEYTAVFAERAVMIWFFDPDPALNRQVQLLESTGTIAPQSVTQFGDQDIYYLDRNGIRSLRARSTTDAAFSSDIGNPIDDILVSRMAALSANAREAAFGLVDPTSGRFWLSLGDRGYIFSYFAGSKISAWSEYLYGFSPSDRTVFDDRVYLRGGDKIYCMGGEGDTPDYSNVSTEVWLPYLDANRPTQKKSWTGIDVACAGTWEVRLGQDPANVNATTKIATVTGTTYNTLRIASLGKSTHASLRFKLLEPPASGPAKLSACVLHHDIKDQED